MDIFSIHRDVLSNYKDFVSGFINIKDDKIDEKVNQELESRRLWPDPLIQFNPSYKRGKSTDDLIQEGVLHQQAQKVFAGFNLFEHQVKALTLGSRDKDFIVTSGTGSGKSLTYQGTIFNHIFNNPGEKGVKAIIVYPMNALINSQLEELKKYEKKFEDRGERFPITFARYTGQEKQEERERIIDEQPDIILTNYMMMELILTRNREKQLRQSFRNSLKYLVYDELHTYRGRQGADVAMQIRRIKGLTRKNLVCIGTSATMAAGNSLQEQRQEVAEVGRQIFGKSFQEDQIIDEEFDLNFKAIPENEDELKSELQQALNSDIDSQAGEEQLREHILGSWLECRVGLEKKEGRHVRRRPMTLEEITFKLSEFTGVDYQKCESKIREFLNWTQNINEKKESDREMWLPYKLHQFIKQSGSVHVTLKKPEDRDPEDDIRLEAGFYITPDDDEEKKLPVFPIVFSRISGHEMLCVRLDHESRKLVPRNFDEHASEDEEEQGSSETGYIIFDHKDEPVWSDEQIDTLPDTWFTSKGALKKEHKPKLPTRISFDIEGQYAFKHDPEQTNAWYVPAPLMLDPTCGISYSANTSEYTKLTKLGSEARSTSTSVLSKAILYSLKQQKVNRKARKVLSFTDVRQDASLQSGHFNDFARNVQMRSAIYQSLHDAPNQRLDHTDIAARVFDNLDLDEAEYAKNPQHGGFTTSTNKNEEAFKKKLFYDILYDLRYGWRVVMPNLEQTGLLEIEYPELETICSQEKQWEDIPGFNQLSYERRREILYLILEYFRKQYAIHHHDLEPHVIETNQREIRNQLNHEWGLGDNERLMFPNWMRLETISNAPRRLATESIGPMSKLGKFLREQPELKDTLGKKAEYVEAMDTLLGKLDGAVIRSHDVSASGSNDSPQKVYRLEVSALSWKAADEDVIYYDKVNYKSLGDEPISKPVHKYFKKLYKTSIEQKLYVKSKEHTGQIKNEQRVEREEAFREGNLNVLFCSPTMELGIDISELNFVHMRNVPPNPANYAQRSGRAGRSGQPALVMTYCANSSPHDRHFFEHSRDMVAGQVLPPRLDINNEELAQAHFHAIYLSEVGTDDLNISVADVLDMTKSNLPVAETVKEKFDINEEQKRRIKSVFNQLFEDESNPPHWYNEEWLDRKLSETLKQFDLSLDRWRTLYKNAEKQRIRAQQILDDPTYASAHEQRRQAERDERQARKQRALLLNKDNNKNQQSEFNPFRYLASEGFLPGYNFTRLPIRAFMPAQDSSGEGDFLSRPRRTALREFAPRNVVYHNGSKYSVTRMNTTDLADKIHQPKVARKSGYILDGEDRHKEICPFTGIKLEGDSERIILTHIAEMAETQTTPRQRISCDEEERASRGYEIDTYFKVDGSMDSVNNYKVTGEEEQLLRLRFIPAAKLYFVNHKWRVAKDEGFLINMATGEWSKNQEAPETGNGNSSEPETHKLIKLYVTETADALYIHPSTSLNVNKQGVITFQYALKNAVEQCFQVEPNEVRVELMGDDELPNILLYEAAEGSLGVLRKLAEEPARFKEVIEKAWDICGFNKPEEEQRKMDPASYDDLLSYYNQYHHKDIDRNEIKAALNILRNSVIEPEHSNQGQGGSRDYDQHFEYLYERTDQDSPLERKFLSFLHRSGLKLPDEAQKNMTQLYVQPDFFYEPNVCVFVDGSLHDNPHVAERDDKQRRELKNLGYQVLVVNDDTDLQKLVEKRPDIFRQVVTGADK